MQFLLTIFALCIPSLVIIPILFLLNKIYNYKWRDVNMFGITLRYKVIMNTLWIISILVIGFLSESYSSFNIPRATITVVLTMAYLQYKNRQWDRDLSEKRV